MDPPSSSDHGDHGDHGHTDPSPVIGGIDNYDPLEDGIFIDTSAPYTTVDDLFSITLSQEFIFSGCPSSVTQSHTALIHSPPAALIPSIISHFPALLHSLNTPQLLSLSHTTMLSTTSSLVYFIYAPSTSSKVNRVRLTQSSSTLNKTVNKSGFLASGPQDNTGGREKLNSSNYHSTCYSFHLLITHRTNPTNGSPIISIATYYPSSAHGCIPLPLTHREFIAATHDAHHPTPLLLAGNIELIAAPHDTTQLTITTMMECHSPSSSGGGGVRFDKGRSTGTSSTLSTLDITGTEAPIQSQYSQGLASGTGFTSLPKKVVNVTLTHINSLTSTLASRHANYPRHDKHMARSFLLTTVLNPATPPLTPSQTLTTETTLATFSSLPWATLPYTLPRPWSYSYVPNTTMTRLTLACDTSAQAVLAEVWFTCSYDRMARHVKLSGKVARKEVGRGGREKVCVMGEKVKVGVSGVDYRLFATSLLWSTRVKDSGVVEYVVVFNPCENDSEVDALIRKNEQASKFTRGTEKGYWVVTPTSDTTCVVKLVRTRNLGGMLNQTSLGWLSNTALVNGLNASVEFIENFERNGKQVDKELRGAFIDPPDYDLLTTEQKSIVNYCLALEGSASPSMISDSLKEAHANVTNMHDGSFRSNRRSYANHARAIKPIKTMKSTVLNQKAVDDGWTVIESHIPFVYMWIKYDRNKAKSEAKQRSIALGRALCTVDCSAKEAMAWYFQHCGRDRKKEDRYKGVDARIVVEEHSEHDHTIALVRTYSNMLKRREFVFRFVACMYNDDSFLVAHWPSPGSTTVDYGQQMNAIRGTSKGILRFVPLSPTQCRLTFHQYFDIGGKVPSWVMNNVIPRAVGVVSEARNSFQRDDEVDEESRSDMAGIIEDHEMHPPEYDDDEIQSITDVYERIGAIEEEYFKDVESFDHLTNVRFIGGVGRASTIVDASIEECCAWELLKMSRVKMKKHYHSGGLERGFKFQNDHCSVYNVVRKLPVPFSKHREWVLRQVWKWSDRDTLVVVHESTPSGKLNEGYTRVTAASYCEYERLEDIGETHQTRVTFTSTNRYGGWFTGAVGVKLNIAALSMVSEMRAGFDQSLSIDGGHRLATIEGIKRHLHESPRYTADENDMLVKGVSYFDKFESSDRKSRRVKTDMPSIVNEILHMKDGTKSWGRSEVTVRTSKEEALAYMWNMDARTRWTSTDTEREVLEVVNDHHQIAYMCMKGGVKGGFELGLNLDPREVVSSMVWRKQELMGSFMIVCADTGHESRPVQEEPWIVKKRNLKGDITTHRFFKVRAKRPMAMLIRDVKPGTCKITMVNQFDIGVASLPALFSDHYLKQALTVTSMLSKYFQTKRTLADFDEDDGRAIGELMMIKRKTEKHPPHGQTFADVRVREMIGEHSGLLEFSRQHEFFEPLMARVILNKLRPAREVAGKMCNLTKTEGRRIGAGLALALATNLTGESAVDEWIVRYPALKEMDKDLAWFREMMEVVAKKLLGEVGWGIKLRLFVGASLSVLDVVSDVNVIIIYLGDKDKRKYAYWLIMMLVSNLCMQLFLNLVQNYKKPKLLLSDALIIATGAKPVLDAFRVSSGNEKDLNQTMEPMVELTGVKSIEMFAESIPGCIIQCYTFMKFWRVTWQCDKNTFYRELSSIAISALCTGFTGATISYDYDVDPVRRATTPAFYGFIPDKANCRLIIFGCMIAQGTLLMLLRSVSASLLMLVDPLYFVYYMCADVGLYILQKLLRRDFTHWMPINGAAIVFISCLVRVTLKIVVDYTAVLQYRSAYELGGIYWSMNLLMAQIATFGSIMLYFRMDTFDAMSGQCEKGGYFVESTNTIEREWEEAIWLVAGLGSAMWFALFGIIFLLMNAKYRSTFFSFETGAEMSLSYFLDGEDDETKGTIFLCNERHWGNIREDVDYWVRENWWRWQEERPAWFDDLFVSTVPNDMIPTASVGNVEKLGGGGRRGMAVAVSGGHRRMSAAKRASIRRMSQRGREDEALGVGGMSTAKRASMRRMSAKWGGGSARAVRMEGGGEGRVSRETY